METTSGRALGLLVLLLMGAAVGAAAPAVNKAEAPPPVVLSQEALKLPSVGSVAVSADGKRVYVGRQYSYDRKRLNLTVVTVDAAGKPSGEPRRYADSEVPLPERTHATVTAILPDAARRKLYLTSPLTSGTTPEPSRLLTVYDLDASGEPTGKPRSYEAGNPHRSLLALARHPRLDLLYMAGWGGDAIYVYSLDKQGEPQGTPKAYQVGGYGKYEAAVSPDGKRLYLGTYPDTLEVVDLDAVGAPTGKPRSFAAGKEPQYLRFQYSPRALYLRREDGRLAVWPLETGGDPKGAPQSLPDLSLSAVATDPVRSRLWAAEDATFQDAFTGKRVVDGIRPRALALREDGAPHSPGQEFSTLARQKGVVMAVGADGRAALVTQSLPNGFLGNRVRDYRLRVTLLEARPASGPLPAALPVTLQASASERQPERLGDLALSAPSSWLNLDPLLKDQTGPLVTRVTVGGPPLAHLRLRVEVAQGDPGAGGKALKTLEDAVEGSALVFLLPGYGFEPAPERLAAIELLSEHAKRYLAAARAVALKPEERPRRFVISPYSLLGGQGHVGQLKTGAETLSLLGFNTVNAYWWDALPPAQMDTVLDSFGLERRERAVYTPPSYFDFDQEKMNPAALDRWAAGLAADAGTVNGGRPEKVVDFYLADEPGWYYPTMLNEVREHPQWLEAFRAYLREKGLKPSDVGAAGWDAVYPIGRSKAADLPSRRLFYWTMRFFPESASRGHRLATEALQRAFKHPVSTPVNWNNFVNRWYIASPNVKIFNNPIADPDSGYGGFDWLQSGRLSAHTLWTEDWFGDQDAQTWSFYGDLLRSGSQLGNQSFGGYVVGGPLGAHPAGARYKVMSLIGHGAKAVNFYCFGPELLFPGNCWSEILGNYKPMAQALRMVGRGERLLYPGRPERGKVALLLPGSSSLWEADSRLPLYYQEVWALHHALVHAGYTVDCVDETDLAEGELGKRGYTTLYLTEPNVARKAQEGVRNWVRDGGTLLVTPGGGTADEYNTPTALLDEVLGVKARAPVRDPATSSAEYEGLPVTETLTLSDEAWGTGEVPLRGPVAALETEGARVAGKLRAGGAGISVNRYGKGRAVACGFLPGWQYWLTPDRSDRTRLPRGWGAAQRGLVTAPARLAETPRPVIASREGVEVCRLQCEKGIALVLLNWTDEPLSSLTLTVSEAGKFRKVTSLERGALRAQSSGGTVKVSLPLENVDVLLLE
jgi:hypothetical protein